MAGVAAAAGVPPPPPEAIVAANNDMRFMLDLEFVELLSNPDYLGHLAQSRMLDDQAFLNYIDYLQVLLPACILRSVCD